MGTNRKYLHYIGIDISKSTLDLTLMKNKTVVRSDVIGNNVIEIKQLAKEYKSLDGLTISNTVFGMEDTGIYTNPLKEALQKLGANIVIESGSHIRNSLGNIRGKTDKIDSERIALYLYKSRDVLSMWQPRRAIIDQLASLSTLRNRLIALQTAMGTPLKEDAGFVKVGFIKANNMLCSRSLLAMQADIKDIDASIKETWLADERLNRLMQLVLSVPSIGVVTALQIIITTNEFKNISTPKKFACYSGVAPFPYKSGTSVSKKTRVSKIANKKMKSLLHICAFNARRCVPDIKEYYLRKTQVEGKAKMLVFNAIRYKLILRVFACVNGDRLYEKEHTSKLQ
jgi:transposase